MPATNRFSTRFSVQVPKPRKTPVNVETDFRGLDLVSPYDLVQNGRTPKAKNFRIYAEDTEGRRVPISTAKGPGEYIDPLDEAANVSVTATDGHAYHDIGSVLNLRAMPFTPSAAGRLTKLEVEMKANTGIGPVLVSIYSDTDGAPGTQLAESSISSADITEEGGYSPVRFIEAPLLTSGTDYWMFIRMQDDGRGAYQVGTNTATQLSKVSNADVSGMTETEFSINYKTYISPDEVEKGSIRYAQDGGSNILVQAIGTSVYATEDDGTRTEIESGLSAEATEYSFFEIDGKVGWVNGYDDMRMWNGTTVETITDTELPILSIAVVHKDKIFGKTAADPNKLVFCENPGNPSELPANQQWYYAWLSVNYIYVPAPKYHDPITALVSFQDYLAVFLTTDKYLIYGNNKNDMSMRQALATKGALSQLGTFSDSSNIYFAAIDGLYRFNGSTDERISDLVQPEFDEIQFPENITITGWKRQIRFYYGAREATHNTDCLIFHKGLEEWQHDTECYVRQGIPYTDGDDDKGLAETSSLVTATYKAEQEYHRLGKPIDFEYWIKYDSMGAPAQRKRILKYFPLIRGVGQPFMVRVDMDKDFQDNPVKNEVALTAAGAVWGQFSWDDGTLWGGGDVFRPKKLRYPGYAYYWQCRISRKAVNNPVMFFGVQYSYKLKRL